MSLNINRQIDDVYYRYKMPKLVAKVEGKGNGIKTVVVNMSEIGKALSRKPAYSTKFFGFELGAQINLDEKNDRYVVNGCHDASKLQELLHAFIKKFVLCQACGNPETSLAARKSALWARCRACGFSEQLDPTHRLTQYILKNPPETEAEGALVEDRSTKRTDESVRAIDNESEDSLILIDRLAIAGDECKQLSVEQQRAVDFHEFVENLFNRREIVPMRQAVEKRATELGLGPAFVVIVMEIVFCNRDTLIEDVELYRVLFQYLSRRGPKQRQMQEFVLAGMEQLLVAMNIVDKSCHFLKALYDSDVVEEEAILKWFHKGPNANNVPMEMSSKILKECSKMVEWLQKADEESD